MEVFDVSVPLSPGLGYSPGDPPVRLELAPAVAGHATTLPPFALDGGTATHARATTPLQAFADERRGVELVPLEALVGPAYVVDASRVEHAIDADALARLEIPRGVARIVFKTGNSERWLEENGAGAPLALGEDAALQLVEDGVLLVGIDDLSIGSIETHDLLVQAGVVALEGLDLRLVPPGFYTLFCLPLILAGSDGAPVRALLARETWE
jgi:arylformamidase